MTTIEWIVAVGGGLIAPFALVWLIGCFLPRQHQLSRVINLKQRPQTVWNSIVAMDRLPSWWPPCFMVERLPDQDGRAVYRQWFRQGRRKHSINLEVTECVEPSRFVTTIADVRGPFQGRWVYEVQPNGDGTRLTVTEYGEIASRFVRTMFRLTMSKSQFVDSYLVCLGRKFGEVVQPQ